MDRERLPAIPGVRFRRLQDDDDYARIARIVNGSKEADGFEHTSTAERIRHVLESSPSWSPATDLLLAEADGDAVGYCLSLTQPTHSGVRLFYHIGFVLPAWRRRGIGTALLAWVEGWQRASAAAEPPEVTCWHECVAGDTERARDALLRRHGYAPVRYGYRMVCALDAVPDAPDLPAPLRYEPVREGDLRRIFEAMNEAFLDHWGDRVLSWEEFLGTTTAAESDLGLWNVVWDGDEVAGMALAEIPHAENAEYGRRRGYVHCVCVRRPWRGRGVARAALGRTLRELGARGYTEAALDVDAESLTGALRLYESLGFAAVETSLTYRKRLERAAMLA